MRKNNFLLACIFAVANLFSQNLRFFNTNQSLINLNPSFAGSNGGLRNQLSYQNQWPSAPFDNNVTYLNTFDAYVKPLSAGIAFSALCNNQLKGENKINSYSFSYAQHISLKGGDLKIIPSVQFGYGRRLYSPGPTTYLNSNPAISTGNTGIILTVIPETSEKNYLDFGSGFMITYRNKFYGGFSLNHINQPDIGTSEIEILPRTFNIHLSYNWSISEKAQLQFFYGHYQQGLSSASQVSVNAVLFQHVMGGIGYGNGDNILFNLGYRHNYFSVVAGYAITKSILVPVNYTTWELHASFNIRNKDQRKALTSFESW